MDAKAVKNAAAKYRDFILPPFGELMDASGIDAVFTLANMFGGGSVYIPSLRTIFKDCIEQDIIHQHKSKSISELGRVYGFSERHIRNIVNKK